MNDSRKAFIAGCKSTLPFQTGVIPFGLLYGTLATNAGFEWWLVLLFSMLVFAGSSQLVFIDLLTQIGSPFQALLGSNFVNMRHLIYSARVRKEFSTYPRQWKIILAYLLTDQLYAIVETRKEEVAKLTLEAHRWYYLGSGIFTCSVWQVSSLAGVYFGKLIPSNWNLDFAIPLMFMPLLFKVYKNKFCIFTSVLAAVFVIAFQKVPFGLGVFSAIICASLAGLALKKKAEKRATL